jgi:hypothetical protein
MEDFGGSADRQDRAAFTERISGRVPHSLEISFLLLVAALLCLPMAGGAAAPWQTVSGGNWIGPLQAPAAPATLERGPVGGDSSSTFWGVVAQTSSRTGIASDASVGGFLNGTPITWFEYTQQTDQCNITSNTLYTEGGQTSGGCGFDIGSLKTWCVSRGPDCHTILVLPGENNNSGEDANMANYIANTLHFQPSYYAIGNEPELWTHYGIAWSHWKNTDHSAPSPAAYSYDVLAGIHAVRSVDPAAKFIGIEADCVCGSAWFTDVAHVDGSLISAIAYHTYPSATLKTLVTPAQFFAVLSGPSNLTTSYAAVRADLAGQCRGCGALPVFVAEYNSGPGWAPSNYAGTWSNAVFLAASIVQAIRANVSMFSIFNLQNTGGDFSWSMMNARGTLSPEGTLYSDLLPHLAMGQFRDVSIRTSAGNVWAVVSGDAGHRTLLVVNANPGEAIDLDLNGALSVGAGTTPTTYQWAGSTSGPSVTHGLLSGDYTIPAQGILMIDFSN